MSTAVQVPEQPIMPPPDPPQEAAPVKRDSKPISRVMEILKITKADELVSELGKFEEAIYKAVEPLRRQLSRDVRTNEVPNLLDHMSDVERWRERVTRWHGLATAFLYHCQSDHFLQPKEKGRTDFDREAYQKRLRAGFEGLCVYLEGLIKCIDSRVNQCKKLLGIED